MTLSDAQLRLLRTLLKRDWEMELSSIMISRCGGQYEDYAALLDARYVRVEGWYVQLTDLGRREYKTQSKGRYF